MIRQPKASTTINGILWIAQGFLAVSFAWAGFVKLLQPQQLPFAWVKDNANLVLITGMLDLLAAIGLVFPALLGIQPKLTLYAAYGTLALMIAASIFHISRGEAKDIGFNICMALVAVFIAWGRCTKAPNRAKQVQ